MHIFKIFDDLLSILRLLSFFFLNISGVYAAISNNQNLAESTGGRTTSPECAVLFPVREQVINIL